MTYIYNKKEWILGEDIMPDEFNNMEEGIDEAHKRLDVIENDKASFYDKEVINQKLEEKANKVHEHIEYAKQESTYSKVETDQKIQEVVNTIPEVDLSDYYNKASVDLKLNDKADKIHEHLDYAKQESTYTKIETDNKIKQVVDSIPDVDLTNYYNKQEVDQKLQNINPPDLDVTNKADKTYVDQELAKKVDKTTFNQEIALKANQTYVEQELNKKANQLTTYTKLETDEKISAAISGIDIPEVDLSNYYNKLEVDSKINSKAEQTEVTTLSGKVETLEGKSHKHTNLSALEYFSEVPSSSYADYKKVTLQGRDLLTVRQHNELQIGDLVSRGEMLRISTINGTEALVLALSDIKIDRKMNYMEFANENSWCLMPIATYEYDYDDTYGNILSGEMYSKKEFDKKFEIINQKFTTTNGSVATLTEQITAINNTLNGVETAIDNLLEVTK